MEPGVGITQLTIPMLWIMDEKVRQIKVIHSG